MTLDYNLLFSAIVVYSMVTFSPGPANICAAQAGIISGISGIFVTGLGIVSASVVWAILAAFGIAALFVEGGNYYIIARIAGAIYIFYLAYKSFLKYSSKNEILVQDTVGRLNFSAAYSSGFFIHITNPKAVLAWGSAMAVGTEINEFKLHQITSIIVVCCIMQMLAALTYGLIFRKLSQSGLSAVNGSFYNLIFAIIFLLLSLFIIGSLIFD